MLISKVYILPSHQGRGLGKEVIAFAEQRCGELGLHMLWLKVNKRNANSIAFYRAQGFEIEASLVSDIGKGYVMDDYKMIKRLAPSS
jgi:ribosomal protein S18 acetylase RimI-like enzyme